MNTSKSIADGLTESIKNSRDQYKSTVSHVDDVSKKTQQVAALAKKDLESITGGDSYAFIYPDFNEPHRGDGYALKIHNAGSQILTGVQVKIAKVFQGSYVPEEILKHPTTKFVSSRSEVITIGTLSAGGGEQIPNFVFTPQLNADGQAYYQLWISAQNPAVDEELFVRRSADDQSFDYRYIVQRRLLIPNSQRKKGDVLADGVWFRRLKEVDWTPPAKITL